MPKYLVTFYYTMNITKEIEAASPDEAEAKATREGLSPEEMGAIFDRLEFDEAVAYEEILPDGSHVPVQ